jgi:hypothetical protein
MADVNYTFGKEITLIYSKANIANNTTTDLLLPQGGAGFKVPPGYDFCPEILHVEVNADLTGGSGTFGVTDDGTLVSNGPAPVLNDTVQVAVAEVNPLVVRIPAGSIVGVEVVATDPWAPTTVDADAVLFGRLVPIES